MNNPLRSATGHGYVAIVNALIAAGSDVNGVSRYGATPLTIAADGPVAVDGYAEIVNVLIAAGAEVNAATEHGGTPLHRAARGGDIEIVNALISAGAKVNTKDNSGDTPLLVAARHGHYPVVETLISAGADVKAINQQGQGSLHLTAGARPSIVAGEEDYLQTVLAQSAEAIRALIAAGANVNAADDDGRTPLHEAAEAGNFAAAEALLAAGADINATDDDGISVILEVFRSGDEEMALALLDVGVEFPESTVLNGLLLSAAWEGSVALIEPLVAAGPDPDGETLLYGVAPMTPLSIAAFEGHTETALALIAAGADLYATDPLGQTVLHTAASVRQFEMIRTLVAAGIDVNTTTRGRAHTPARGGVERDSRNH